ncbi:MAG: M1 family metallopeptidase [Lachnospiraceae bacterium]|nr:M1 family metallopeptidase [Lachnospiraceae bacterium]
MKRITAVFLIVVLLLALTACGKNNGGDERKGKNATPTTAQTPTEALTPTDAPTPTEEPGPTDVVTPTDEPTPAPTETPTPEATPTPATGTYGQGLTAPAKNCAIEMPTRKLYHYDMDLTLDTENNTIGGHVVFEFYNDTNDSWSELCMRDYPSLFTDTEGLGYEEVVYENGAMTVIENIKDGRDNSMLTYRRDTDDSVVWIELAHPLSSGENMTLEYDFTAKIPRIDDRFGLTKEIYNVTNFYPILAEYTSDGWSHVAYYLHGECFYSEVSNYDVRLTVPAGYKLAATGVEKDRTENGDTVTYTLYAPAVRDFVFSASSKLLLNSDTYEGVRVNVWYKDDYISVNMNDVVKYTHEAARYALAALGEAFGRYPYEELDIVMTPMTAGGGMEYPNLIQIGDSMFVYGHQENPNGGAMFYDLQTTVAHEIGHQWFMGIVGSDSGLQPWQDESITSYTEKVFADYVNTHGGNMTPPYLTIDDGEEGKSLAAMFRDEAYVKEQREREMLPINRGVHDYSTDYRYSYSIYSMGEIVLEAFEEVLGQEDFYAVIREYVHRNAFSNADPMSFYECLFACAGTDNEAVNAIFNAAFDISEPGE